MSEFDKKISALTSGSDSQAADEYVIARGGANYKITGANIAAAATKLGTIATGVWQGTAIANTYIATGLDVTKLTTGATLPSNVLASSLTSVGTLSSLTVSGTSSLNGAVTINDAGADVDFRVEGDTNANLIFGDASTDRVGIGTNAPGTILDVSGTTTTKYANVYSGVLAEETQLRVGYSSSFNWAFGRENATTGDLIVKAMTSGVDSSTLLRLTPSGNLGLGVTPSAWTFTGVTALQIKNAGFWGYQNRANVTANGFVNNTGAYSYIANGFATTYEQDSGKHVWYTAASGTAGNAITFTQAMTLDASGNLLVNTTTQRGRISAVSTGYSVLALGTSSTSGARGGAINFESEAPASRGQILYDTGSDYMAFNTAATERARIVSNGRIEMAESTINGPYITSRSGTAVSVASGGTITLMALSAGSPLIVVYEESSGNGGAFFASYTGTVTKIAGEGEATDTGSTFAVYKSANSHTITFKNKFATTRTFAFGIYSAEAL